MKDWYDRDGIPPWETGTHQPAYAYWVENNDISGNVADIGCGTGENALFLADHGFEVIGYDFSPTAIRRAQEKAEKRNIKARFQQIDIMGLESEDRRFDTIVESGLIQIRNEFTI